MDKITTSIVIPTINRHQELINAFESILNQTRLPTEVIIIDQTPVEPNTIDILREKISNSTTIDSSKLKYTHDPNITGSAEARNIGVQESTSDIILFLDDDVILESDFIANIVCAYQRDPDIVGVSGVPSNYPQPNKVKRFILWAFYRGPFRDERPNIYWKAHEKKTSLYITVTRFGAGLMSIKRNILNKIGFDTNYVKYSLGEDVDLTYRISRRHKIVIATDARLEHLQAPSNRYSKKKQREALLCAHYYFFKKNVEKNTFNWLLFLWMNLGFIIESLIVFVAKKNIDSILATIAAYRMISNNLQGCDFLVPNALDNIIPMNKDDQ